ncbi:AMP-binding domain containing protein, partial [Asbolus verrucosus]
IDGQTGEELTYGRLLKLSIGLALELKKFGVKKGDVITILSQNNWKYLLTVISGFYIGAKINLPNPDCTTEELKHILSICQPALIFGSAQILDKIVEFGPKTVITFDETTSTGTTNFDKLLEPHGDNDAFNPTETDIKSVALITTSSENRGLPKCVLWTHSALRLSLVSAGLPTFTGMNEKESTIGHSPFFDIFGNTIALACVYYGTKLVVLENFTLENFLRIIHIYKITKLFTDPQILHYIEKSSLLEVYDTSSVNDLLCVCTIINKDLEEVVKRRLNLKSVRHIYGKIGGTAAVTISPKNCDKIGTIGKIVTGHQIKVCDFKTGNLLAANQIGELRIKGDGVMEGYLGDHSPPFDSDGFLKTGDLGYFDKDEFFYTVDVDRIKDVIHYEGHRISPAELENILIQHPDVKDVGVTGIPDEKAGEVAMAFIVRQPKKNVTEKEFVRYVDEMVSEEKRLHGGIDGQSGEEINYGKLLQLSVKLAIELKKLGVKKGEIITIISQNSWKYIITTIASLYVGASVNLLNPDYTTKEFEHFFTLCKPTLIFCSAKVLDKIFKLQDLIPENIITFDKAPSPQAKYFDELLEDCSGNEDLELVDVNPKEDIALVLTSSGTTGMPKYVLITHSSFRVSLMCARLETVGDMNEKDTTLGYLPFFHVFGALVSISTVLHGTKLIILEKFVPEIFLKAICSYKVTKLFAVPQILQFLAKSPLLDRYDISSITDMITSTAPAGKDLEELVKTRLKNMCVRQSYGMTEVCGPITLAPKTNTKAGSTGKVLPGLQLKVCHTENGQALPSNQVGEIRIMGETVMKGYLGSDESVFDEEGFFKSGDLGYYDEEEFFYIVSRLKDIIKYKGFQVSPVELENILMQHPAVKEAAVIGIPDERAGEVPLAFIVKHPEKNVTEDKLVRYLNERISVQKRLYGGVKFVDEIPKNSTGKVLRGKLKELL